MKSERNHQRAEIRRDVEKGRKIKNGGDWVAAIIEGKNYELIDRNESRYRRGDGVRRVDRGRHGPGVGKGNRDEWRVRSSVFLSTISHDLSARLHPDLGIIGHVSAQPFVDERARTARRVRAHSQSYAGRTWFG
jgi:hypothetical protein